jgi:putative peptide zinc metalloprotease protein
MLCSRCRCQLARGTPRCDRCGTARIGGAPTVLELVTDAGTRIPLTADMTIGRAEGSTLRLDHPTISRSHALIRAGNGFGGGPVLEDAGSSHGTFLDDAPVEGPAPLEAGSRIRMGNLELRVEGRRDDGDEGPGNRTIVIGPGASLMLPAVGAPELEPAAATRYGFRPRLRAGARVKQLDASEGARWLVQEPDTDTYLHVNEDEGGLLLLLDGQWSLAELIAEATSRLGPLGAPRLARLLADLGDRGLLAGVAGAVASAPEPQPWWRRLSTPRIKTFPSLGPAFTRAYRRGGWVLFTRPALALLALVAVAGLAAEIALIVGRYGTPFVVARHLGLGALIFLAGRWLVVVVHEAAHGMAMASYGRAVRRAGIKVVAVFPYSFVDTSESWFEPRRRRIAVAAAGPVADLCCGGAFALICLVLPAGTARDIFFQLAFAAYVGAFFNLNPFLDRDGYHIIVDVLRAPGLRARARAQLTRRLSGYGEATDDRALTRYAAAGVAWSIAAAGLGILVSLRYAPVMERIAPPTVVWIVLGTGWAILFLPAVLTVGRPLLLRRRRR